MTCTASDRPTAGPSFEEVAQGFAASPEGRDLRAALTRLQRLPDGHYRMHTRIVLWPHVVALGLAQLRGLRPLDVTPTALRGALLADLPRYRPFRPEEAAEIVEELAAWLRYLARAHQAPHARACLGWLLDPRTLASLRLEAVAAPIGAPLPALPPHLRPRAAAARGRAREGG